MVHQRCDSSVGKSPTSSGCRTAAGLDPAAVTDWSYALKMQISLLLIEDYLG